MKNLYRIEIDNADNKQNIEIVQTNKMVECTWNTPTKKGGTIIAQSETEAINKILERFKYENDQKKSRIYLES